ncbi:MAG TPA: hypothetical protein PKD90_11350, partial [Phnomibacter sp.]|nr:hypothetical protein [Phnomibacter sp.]
LAAEGITLYKHHRYQEVPTPFKPYVPSISSLLILIYGFPTMVTGIVLRFKPMIIGGAVCSLLFILSLFTNNTWDNLLNGLAGIFNWLIPGLILQRKYQRKRQAPAHV